MKAQAFLSWLLGAAVLVLKVLLLAGAALAFAYVYARHGLHADPGEWPLP